MIRYQALLSIFYVSKINLTIKLNQPPPEKISVDRRRHRRRGVSLVRLSAH